MAGHSKWANIRFRKGAQDAKRGKIFTKLIREIVVATRMGGDKLDSNPRLRDAINKALKANMKRDTVDNAIKRGAGNLDGDNYQEVRYEGYGPGGVAVLVDCLTDNINRTVAEVRHAFSKHGGNLGTNGSVAYLFQKLGVFSFDNADEEHIMDIALEAGADDVVGNDDGSVDVQCEYEQFTQINDAFTAKGLEATVAEITMRSSNEVSLDEEGSLKVIKLIDVLEDLDDVQNVYTNALFSDNLQSEE